MKKEIQTILEQAAVRALKKLSIELDRTITVDVERTKDSAFGDLSSNIAMKLASFLKKNPREIASLIIAEVTHNNKYIKKLNIAGPGFINLFLSEGFWRSSFLEISKEGERYGCSDLGKGKRVLVEFVSANPTGPLHVGHGRGAVTGDVISNILEASGYNVVREYYVNDRGNQMNNLGMSTWARYQQYYKRDIPFPENGYKGDYIKRIAEAITKEKGDSLLDADPKEIIPFFTEYSRKEITESIKNDLKMFGIKFDNWFSETSLFETGKVDRALAWLKENGYSYYKDGALWFKSTLFGDDKDRVLIKEDGEYTYFAADIAYHKDKLDRGFDRIVDIWGADHGGYVNRIKGVLSALGAGKDLFNCILIQLVSLKQGSMSTRAGTFVPLKDVIDDVGMDVARFNFLMRSADSHLEFDLDLAKQESKENPVFYVQYAHARIQSILRMAKQENIDIPSAVSQEDMSLLTLPDERELMKCATCYPDVLRESAILMEPHKITFYLKQLTSSFHKYYYKNKVLTEDKKLTKARIILVMGIRQIIRNALGVIGVKPVDKM